MKKIKAAIRILIAIGIISIMIIAILQMQSRQCEKILVKIHHEGSDPTVTQEDIIHMFQDAGVSIIGEEIKEIDKGLLSGIIARNPFIEKINKVFFAGTTLIIDIQLRELLLRVFPEEGVPYFMDKSGFLLPYSLKVKDNLLVANGAISETYKDNCQVDTMETILHSLHTVAKILNDDDFYSAQFRQIHVTARHQLELIPSVGKHIVLFGDEKSAGEKLFNLKETYKNALVYMDMDQYALLDVRFKNRVVARRK